MIRYYPEIVQGSDEWLAVRCGLLTASEMKLILTPTLKIASNDKERAHLYELAAQRVTRYVEPSYIGDDMLRGMEDEIEARALYAKHYAPVKEMGFVTNDKWGFTLGYSPDGLVGTDGQIEAKSRRQKYQFETIVAATPPEEYLLQLQTGLLVTERQWCDFLSYSGGMPMVAMRAHPDDVIRNAILEASAKAEERIAERIERYHQKLRDLPRTIPTERRVEQEMFV